MSPSMQGENRTQALPRWPRSRRRRNRCGTRCARGRPGSRRNSSPADRPGRQHTRPMAAPLRKGCRTCLAGTAVRRPGDVGQLAADQAVGRFARRPDGDIRFVPGQAQGLVADQYFQGDALVQRLELSDDRGEEIQQQRVAGGDPKLAEGPWPARETRRVTLTMSSSTRSASARSSAPSAVSR